MNLIQHGPVTSALGEVSYGGFSMSVYVFYLDGMLIDTGSSRMLEDLIPFYNQTPIELVSLTHLHEDHTGTAYWLHGERQLPVYIKKESIPSCEREADLPMYRGKLWGARKPFTPLPYRDTIQSNHYTYKPLHTPGHEENHIVLYDEDNGRLFSGDLFIHPKPKVIMEQESIPTMMKSIKSILSLDFQEMFCQHAGFIEDGKKAMKMKLDYLEELSGQVTRLFEKGFSVEEMDHHLFPKKPAIIHLSKYEYDSKHMIRSIVENIEQGNG